MEYTLIRAKRKTISIAIKPDGTVEVRCPVRMPKRDVDLFVTRHTDWITRHRAVVEERNGRRARFDFSDGQSFYFLGQA
ncbi:MAG: M48 family metallopeptidase, partial [Oscillospiraceae bacterium]|nr:M48 family metallopeptidase [Oscillospiraceae bacterium]